MKSRRILAALIAYLITIATVGCTILMPTRPDPHLVTKVHEEISHLLAPGDTMTTQDVVVHGGPDDFTMTVQAGDRIAFRITVQPMTSDLYMVAVRGDKVGSELRTLTLRRTAEGRYVVVDRLRSRGRPAAEAELRLDE